MDKYDILRAPMITEKSTALKETDSVLTFKVDRRANKQQIKEAVERLLNVKVDQVRTANFHGKLKRMGRSRGHRPDWKKAYVKLKAGQKLPEFFETV
ncbi:MAG: 50S ribosomal protein L23 [Acidobacteria bacterium]|nr:50S ribosomal protein L23 [Acidobacteriota bacterium]